MHAPKPSPSAPLITAVSIGLLVLFALFLAGAVLSVLKHRHGARQYNYDQNFVAIQADAVESRVSKQTDGFSIVTLYRFTPPGKSQSYEGHDRFDLQTYKSQSEAEAKIAKSPQKVTVYFSPENPADSSSKPSPPTRPPGNFLHLVAGIAGALSFVFAGMRITWDQFWRCRELTSYHLFSVVLGAGVIGFGLLLLSFATLAMLVLHVMTGSLSYSYHSPRQPAMKQQENRRPPRSNGTAQQAPPVEPRKEEPRPKSSPHSSEATKARESQVKPSPAVSPSPSQISRSVNPVINYIFLGMGSLGLLLIAAGLMIGLRSLKSKPRVSTELF